MGATLDQLAELLEIDGGALVMVDSTTSELVFEAAWGILANEIKDMRLPPGAGITSRVIANRQPYLSNNIRKETDVARPDLLREGLQAAACVPLIARDETIGALWVSRTTWITHAEMRLLAAVGDIAAGAIHRANLYEHAQRRVRHLAALHDIHKVITYRLDLHSTLDFILAEAAAQLEVDAVNLMRLNQSIKILEHVTDIGFRTRGIARSRWRLGEGYAGRAALDRRRISVHNLNNTAGAFPLHHSLFAGEDFVTYFGVPLVTKGQVKGVLEIFHRSPFNPDIEWLDFLESLATQAAIAIDADELVSDLRHYNEDLTLAYDATIEGWSKALELRDQETEGHTQRATELTLRLAQAMGIRDDELVQIRRGALLHDIGKMGVPDSILLKPGFLTEDEWVFMRRHPVYAYDMLSPILYLRGALDIPYYHHERWDGTGYPRGLKGEQIPLAARIFAVVDTWDALSYDRPYRKSWPEEKVREYIIEQSGKHFDPQIVETFLPLVS